MSMKNTTMLILVIILAVLPANLVQAAPAAQSGNLLSSSGFETSFSGGVAENWSKWHENTDKADNYDYAYKPDWSAETVTSELIHSGSKSQHIGNFWDPWHAGVMQTVSVAPGTRVRFTAWARIRSSNEFYPAASETGSPAAVQVGIDPEGAGLWYSNVTWSGAIAPFDVWQSVSIEATAGASGKVTVFISANFRGNGLRQKDAWFDDAVLEAVSAPTATPVPVPTQPPAPPATAVPVATNTPLPTSTPEATATPVDSPTPTNTPEPTATPTPLVGRICSVAFDDTNRNGMKDGIEGAISGATITLFDGHQVIGTQTTNAMAGEVCFENLQAGPYQVFQTLPQNRLATTADNVPVDLQSGQSVSVLFGSSSGEQAAPTSAVQAPVETAEVSGQDNQQAEPSSSSGNGGLMETLFAISGIVVLLVAAVLVGIFFIFRNKTPA